MGRGCADDLKLLENTSLPVGERSSGGPLAPLRPLLSIRPSILTLQPSHPNTPPTARIHGRKLKDINSEGEKKALAGEYRKKGRGPAQGGARKSNRLTVMNVFESWTGNENGRHSRNVDAWVMFIMKSWQPIVE